MKITFALTSRKGETKTLAINGWAKVLLSLCMLGMPVTAGIYLGLQLSGGNVGLLLEHSIDSLEQQLHQQRQALAAGKVDAEQKIQALTLKLAELQARLLRLDAVGERLTTMADLDDGEFDFSRPPAMGGPESEQLSPVGSDIQRMFDDLEQRLESREQQLAVLSAMLADRKLTHASTVSGRPVAKGFVSSGFGYRTDPFNGHKAWHNGVDFAGRSGSHVVAVAAGVVTHSGTSPGYGNLVEIDHGEGFVTRYGHNKENTVKVGDIVEKGQVVAVLGATGRSTGPHVHFEVYKNGRPVDPSAYIRRTLR